MSDESCNTCRFWHKGYCRRYPPVSQRYEYQNTRKGYMESDVAMLWPETDSDDWCGEFKSSKPDTIGVTDFTDGKVYATAVRP